MADNLFPEGYETEIIEDLDRTGRSAVGYQNGIAFDDGTGDFKRDGRNTILDATGVESWKNWCVNCIQTERYKHLAYSTDFGIDLDAALHAESREAAESILTREITEAVAADPYGRCAYIESLAFDWTAPDAIRVDAVLHGIDDVTIDLTAYITKGDA